MFSFLNHRRHYANSSGIKLFLTFDLIQQVNKTIFCASLASDLFSEFINALFDSQKICNKTFLVFSY